MTEQSFGATLRHLIETRVSPTGRRWTQGDLAAAVGVERNTVSAWLNRGVVPRDPDVLSHLAELFGTTVDQLLGRVALAQEPPNTPRVAAGLPYRVRVWLQGFLLEITKAGATEEEVEEARQLLTSPEVFVYFSGGAPKEFDEDDVLDGMEALGEVVRRTLRKRGRKL